MADSNLYWMNVKGCMVSCLLEHFNDGMGKMTLAKRLLNAGTIVMLKTTSAKEDAKKWLIPTYTG